MNKKFVPKMDFLTENCKTITPISEKELLDVSKFEVEETYIIDSENSDVKVEETDINDFDITETFNLKEEPDEDANELKAEIEDDPLEVEGKKAGKKRSGDGKARRQAKKGGEGRLHLCNVPGCNQGFSRPSRLKVHMHMHTGERPFKCTKCDKTYSRNAHLKRHMETNHSEMKVQVSFVCGICDKSYSLKQNLQKHIRRTHENRFKCDECDAAFTKNKSLRVHKKTHQAGGADGEAADKYSCNVCNKAFASASKLKKHRRVHDGYKCDDCDIVMEKWSDLVMHRKTHTAEPLAGSSLTPCDVCNKSFSARYMKMHKMVHDETRPVFHCPVINCPRYFYFLRNLKQHTKSYHEGNRFQCTVSGCELKLSTKQKLQEHMVAKHSQNMKLPPKPRKKPRARKDKGMFKKPMAAVITRIEVENGDQLMKQEKKQPLQNLEELKMEGKEFVGSTFDTSDSEGVVIGCRRPFNIKQKKVKELPRVVADLIESDCEGMPMVLGYGSDGAGAGYQSSDTDTDREMMNTISPHKPNFASFIKR